MLLTRSLMARHLSMVSCGMTLVAGTLMWIDLPRTPAITPVTVETAMRRGVAFLRHAQLQTGEFPVEERLGSRGAWHRSPTPFGTAMLLYSLHTIPGHPLEESTARGLQFLESHKTPKGLWQYHESTVPNLHIPPDADDTSVSAVALLLYGHVPDTTLEALSSYRDVQGRFFTWPHDEVAERLKTLPIEVKWTRNDIDCVVNAHMLQLATAQGTTLPNVCAWLLDIVQQDAAAQHSVFYTTPWLDYAIIKAKELGAACLTPAMEPLKVQLEHSQRPNGSWGNLIETAIALSTATVVGVSHERQQQAVAFLLAQQRRNGGWPRQLAYTADRRHPDTWQYGSAALTTGLAVEALNRFLRENNRANQA